MYPIIDLVLYHTTASLQETAAINKGAAYLSEHIFKNKMINFVFLKYSYLCAKLGSKSEKPRVKKKNLPLFSSKVLVLCCFLTPAGGSPGKPTRYRPNAC